jgi:hypothetical protein
MTSGGLFGPPQSSDFLPEVWAKRRGSLTRGSASAKIKKNCKIIVNKTGYNFDKKGGLIF